MLLLPSKASIRVFSYGGGVQSNAILAMQAMGELLNPYDVFVFSNVGNDSENPKTIEYIESYAKPFAEKHGIRFVETQKIRRGGKAETLKEYIFRTERSVPIPAYMGGNGSPGNRSCTTQFKIEVVDKWVKDNQYPYATIGVGISIDEFQRMRPHMTKWNNRSFANRKLGFWKRLEYPLIDMRINRQKCLEFIREVELPPAPKSSCFFCPFKKRSEWIEMKRKQPELFQEVVEIDDHIREKRKLIGRDGVYIHPDLIPIRNAVGDQPPLFEMDDLCDTGYCFT